MKKKLPAIFLAVGLTAAPAFAKLQNRRADNKVPSGIEQNNNKRSLNSVKRLRQMEAEKEFIRETEDEIQNIVGTSFHETVEEQQASAEIPGERIVIQDKVPVNGIDLSAHFNRLKNKT